MELVLLQDVQNSFSSNWVRVANSTGIEEIHIGDRFRERGFGPGAEELEVAGVDISPVGGMSRLFFNRGGNATKPEVHRLGAVLEQVGIKAEPVFKDGDSTRLIAKLDTVTGEYTHFKAEVGNASDATAVTNQPTNGSASAGLPPTEAQSDEALVPVKRKRGRPPGSKNKTHMEVALPAGFE